MFELKRLSPAGVPAALTKAERYRLLNEPWEAESICRDVLEVAPDKPEVLVMLLLALTDQFETEPGTSVAAARGDGVLRAGRGAAPDGGRRRDPAVEHVRAADHEARAAAARGGAGTRRGATRVE